MSSVDSVIQSFIYSTLMDGELTTTSGFCGPSTPKHVNMHPRLGRARYQVGRTKGGAAGDEMRVNHSGRDPAKRESHRGALKGGEELEGQHHRRKILGKDMRVLPPESFLGENERMTLVKGEGLCRDDYKEHRMPSSERKVPGINGNLSQVPAADSVGSPSTRDWRKMSHSHVACPADPSLDPG